MTPRDVIPFLDLTTLDAKDTPERVEKLARRAMRPIEEAPEIHCGALCVWPNFAGLASKILEGSGVALACVAAGFPCSQSPLAVKCAEIEAAVSAGADEIDIAINRGLLVAGDLDAMREELRAMKAACGEAHLKVILETCDLADDAMIRSGCKLALECGADFLKTSTGKGSYGATLDHTRILLEEAADWTRETGRMIGVKPAGGVRTYEEAVGYLDLAKSHLREVTPATFRIGASSLLDDLLARR